MAVNVLMETQGQTFTRDTGADFYWRHRDRHFVPWEF